MSSSTGANDSISSEAAVAMAAVMGLRQQHLAVANQQHHSESDLSNFSLRSGRFEVNSLALAENILKFSVRSIFHRLFFSVRCKSSYCRYSEYFILKEKKNQFSIALT